MNHRPRKRFGQNFLEDKSFIHKILTALHLQADDKMIEVGPGLGALTQPLLQHLNHLIAVEIDRDLQAYLCNLASAKDKLQLIDADVLTVDFGQFGQNLRVVGNLPYNISTPLLFHLLNFSSQIKDMHFMLQKEVVQRLAAHPGTKAYGRLSVLVQYYCAVEFLFEVPPEAFNPKPKVNSAIVRLVPHEVLPYAAVNVSALSGLVARAFAMRRKTLANNLKPIMSANQIKEMGVDPLARPEQISVAEYVRLSNALN